MSQPLLQGSVGGTSSGEFSVDGVVGYGLVQQGDRGAAKLGLPHGAVHAVLVTESRTAENLTVSLSPSRTAPRASIAAARVRRATSRRSPVVFLAGANRGAQDGGTGTSLARPAGIVWVTDRLHQGGRRARDGSPDRAQVRSRVAVGLHGLGGDGGVVGVRFGTA